MKKTRLVVWGCGDACRRFIEYTKLYPCEEYEIVGITDSYKSINDCSINGIQFYDTEGVNTVDFDAFCIAVDSSSAIRDISESIKYKTEFRIKRVYTYMGLINTFRKQRILKKYTDTSDPIIKQIIEYLKTNDLTVRTIFENNTVTKYPFYYDESGFPYVIYCGKRMYYPKQYPLLQQGYVENIVESDQYEGSPHLYVQNDHGIKDGDTIIDAGVCEGNFALKYVDVASRIYLIEPDPNWQEPLKKTFAPYREKVKFVFKKLGDIDSIDSVTIDSMIPMSENVDFIKMDIEGFEPLALLGGIDTLRRCHPKLSICAYHRYFDEKYIKFILQSVGYTCSVSNGLMFMLYDDCIDETLDFRHGVVYGDMLN